MRASPESAGMILSDWGLLKMVRSAGEGTEKLVAGGRATLKYDKGRRGVSRCERRLPWVYLGGWCTSKVAGV